MAAAAITLGLVQPRWRASATIVLHMSGPQILDKVKGVTEDAEGRRKALDKVGRLFARAVRTGDASGLLSFRWVAHEYRILEAMRRSAETGQAEEVV